MFTIIGVVNNKLHLIMDKTEKYKKAYQGEFETIDTEAKAYFLGYFHADGNLYYNKTAYSSQTKIKLGIKDEHILRDMLVHFPFFSFSYTSDKYEYKGKIKINQKCLLRSYNKKLFTDLLNLNVKGGIPNISEDLMPHFIRGLIDGDGSFNVYSRQNNKRYYAMDLCMESMELAKAIGAILQDEKIDPRYNWDRKIVKLRVRKKQDLLKLIKYIYKDANLYLKRKKEIADEIVEYYLAPVKSDELLENPEEDNQQPSLGSAKSTKKVQRLDGEEHNQ